MKTFHATTLHALARQLCERHWMLTCAESCTGGRIASVCTTLPGSSRWFERGFVTYSNAAKVEMLGVPSILIDTHGAVSEEVAQAMAQGALKHSHAHIAVATTGVAGPGGATATKPVGLVCFAWATEARYWSAQQHFSGNRATIQEHAAIYALRVLLDYL